MITQSKQFSYAEWLYHMDGGDAVYGSIELWANLKQYRLPKTTPLKQPHKHTEKNQS
jgi:hypothetical protein